jgi:hypothetical protein
LTWVDTDNGLKQAESAGVYALSGVINQIDEGIIKGGENVCIAITGGSRVPGKTLPVPDFIFDSLPTMETMQIFANKLFEGQSKVQFTWPKL